MVYDKNELLKSLRLIKEICRSHECRTCPLGEEDGHCVLQGCPPVQFDIKTDEENPIWRAFI